MCKEWKSLQKDEKNPPRSGIEAWHKYCYDMASKELKDKHIISESDPNQSWGKPRAKYK